MITTKREHIVRGKFDPLLVHQGVVEQRVHMKPSGLWYGVDGGWEEWCASEMPQWLGGAKYELDLDESKILIVRNIEAFDKEYGVTVKVPGAPDLDHFHIDWPRIAKSYSGVEIPSYSWNHRHEFMWYYGWDCASGCVWNPDCVKSIMEVAKI